MFLQYLLNGIQEHGQGKACTHCTATIESEHVPLSAHEGILPMTQKPTYEALELRIQELTERISGLEQTIASLRESEEKFRTIFENAPVMIDAFDESGRCLLWNHQCERMLGWKKQELLAMDDPLAILYPEHLLYDRVIRNKTNPDGKFREYRVTHKDGSQRIQVWANFKLPTAALISAGLDITEYRQAEEALKKSEKHFKDLVEHSLAGISIIQDERIIYRNPEQQRLLGPLPINHAPLVYEHIHPDDVPTVQRLYRDLFSGRQKNPGMVVRYFPAGDTKDISDMKWLHCRATLIEYEGSQAIMINMMDVTIAKELERILHIQDRMTSLGHVAAGIAHEIRNPLSGINIYLNALEKIFTRGDDLHKAQDVLAKMQSASCKIESVIKRVMDFSKPSVPQFSLIRICDPIEDALALSSVTLRKTDVEVERKLNEDLPRCYADPQLIEQVLLNLITNAAEAMKDMDDGKRIRISTSAQKDSLVITVEDSGPGIAPDRRHKIFDPFYSTKTGSTGIGLSLSHRIITDHGGSLDVTASPLGGAEFIICLPTTQGVHNP